ncbi:MAG: NTP/NDP exchange transporter, partial [Longimicrobiales bacterium]
LATAYGFCILLSYYILRPVRDEISSADRGNLQILWTAVFIVMLIAVPIYSSIVSRYSRGVFIPLANRFFALSLLTFYAGLLLLPETARPWIDRVFYVWASVFALFVVTVFWGFIADLFRNRQGRRLFGFIAVGSSLGGIVGSLITASTSEILPAFSLLLLAIVPLEGAALFAKALHRSSGDEHTPLRKESTELIAGDSFSGIRTVFQSPYLLKIAGYLALMTFASTVLYFQQAELIRDAFVDRAARTAFYAKIDLAVNVLTILTQGLLAAHVIRKIGVALSLAFLPALTLLGFLSLGVYPLLAVLVGFQVLYRTGRYGITRPAREVLFTVVSREERYKSKAFIDAAVYRGGDLVSGWIYTGLAALGLSLGAIALVAVPVAGLWAGVGFLVGRQQEELLTAADSDEAATIEAMPDGAS